MLAESVQFDANASRCSYSDQPIPPGGVARALRQSAESTGLDVVAELYNEALRTATEGHYKASRETLRVLVTLAPEDGEARLLLAKVLVAGQKWKDALAALDEAAACGAQVPGALRQAIEEHLRADLATEDEERAARMAREQGEIKALRQEARRLRSENAQYVGRTRELERETRKWAWTTAGVSTVAILFVLGNLVLGGGSGAVDEPAVAAVIEEQPALVATTATATAAAASVARPEPSLEERVGTAVNSPSLDGSTLEARLQGSSVTLVGAVPTWDARKEAERLLLAIPGITTVDANGVEVLARTRGTTHTVAKGDNLSKIASTYYGQSTLSSRILKANHTVLKGKPDLQVGQELVIPPVE